MTERLSVTRAQARAMCDVAAEKRCIVEVERDGPKVIYRVIPEDLARDERRDPDDEISPSEFDTPRRITL